MIESNSLSESLLKLREKLVHCIDNFVIDSIKKYFSKYTLQ